MDTLHTILPLTLPASIGFGTLLHLTFATLAILHILRRPGDARGSLLWIVFVTAFPVLGPLAYLFFGINTTHENAWRKQTSDRSFLQRHLQGTTSHDGSTDTQPLPSMLAQKKTFQTHVTEPYYIWMLSAHLSQLNY